MKKPERLDDAMLFDWPLFWGSDHVRLMSDREALVYALLLSVQWRDGELPAKTALLALRASSGVRQVTPEQFGDLEEPAVGSIWAALKPCFETDGYTVWNARVRADRDEWISKKGAWKEQRAAAGRASGEARRKKAKRTDLERSTNGRSTAVERNANGTATETNSPSLSSSLSLSRPKDQEKKESVGDRSDLTTDLEVEDPQSGKRKGPSRAEIAWRVADTWVHFLERRARYYRVAKGRDPPGSPPTMDEFIKTDIRKALRVHDASLLDADQREAWRRDSKTRAAGGGMYLTPWNLGKREETDADGNGKRATTYLEAWRPWRIRKGRDPVNEFAEMYFDKRAVAEAAEEAERTKP